MSGISSATRRMTCSTPMGTDQALVWSSPCTPVGKTSAQRILTVMVL